MRASTVFPFVRDVLARPANFVSSRNIILFEPLTNGYLVGLGLLNVRQHEDEFEKWRLFLGGETVGELCRLGYQESSSDLKSWEWLEARFRNFVVEHSLSVRRRRRFVRLADGDACLQLVDSLLRRPAMFVGSNSLTFVEHFLRGASLALRSYSDSDWITSFLTERLEQKGYPMQQHWSRPFLFGQRFDESSALLQFLKEVGPVLA